ncbi:hypothetical protein LV779_37005 [Streptomyces thinghirensis]|nr:hypothetical protein [Streptomyces thinghirensis]
MTFSLRLRMARRHPAVLEIFLHLEPWTSTWRSATRQQGRTEVRVVDLQVLDLATLQDGAVVRPGPSASR